jgi:serine/threonine protein kinase
MLREFGKLEENVIARYTQQVLLGLRYLHKQRIVHRDIKGP